MVIRLVVIPDQNNPAGHKKIISLTDEGELYIGDKYGITERYICIYMDAMSWTGVAHSDWIFNKHNRVSVRHIHDKFKTSDLSDLTMQFYERYIGSAFPGSTLPFIGA